MRVGIDSYCFHRYYGEVYESLQSPSDTSWDVFDFLDYVDSTGATSVSLETCFLPALEGAFADELRARLDASNFDRVVSWGHPAGLNGGRDPAALDELRAHIPRAAQLGATVMRIVGGSSSTRGLPREPQIRTLVEWLRVACGTAKEHDVCLAMENHNDFTAREMLRIIDGVGSEHLGVTLDTGNAVRVFEDPVEATRLLAPYTVATHLKDVEVHPESPRGFAFWRSCPIGQGIIDIPAVVRTLAAAGYEGALTVEIDLVHPRWEQLPEETIVRESVAYIRQTLADLRIADG